MRRRDPDELREVAAEELNAAFVRYLARVGEAVGVHETFAMEVAQWMFNWAASYTLPDTPVDPELERQLDEEVERARRDLELLGDEADMTSQEPE